MNWLAKIFSKATCKRHKTSSNSKKSFAEIYADPGSFTYGNDGFTITYEDFTKRIKWIDITQINVYKVDLFTFDEIEMEIVYNGKAFTISEELPGWYQFVLKTKTVFPAIPKDWDMEIIQPAFASNYRTIYNKENC